MFCTTSRRARFLFVVTLNVVAMTLYGDLVSAQTAEVTELPMKVGVIDVQRLVFESATGKEMLEKLKNLREQKAAEGTGMKQEVEDLQRRVADGRLSLSDDRLADLEKEMEDKLIDLKRFSDDAERLLQKEQEESFGRIERQVMPIISEVGAEQGYTMIFNKFNSGLLYAEDHVDLTEVILHRFDTSVQESSAQGGS